jgi:hypothetical protein
MEMKKSNIKILLNSLLVIIILVFSACEANKCKTRGIECINNGVCYDGICNCPAGFDGDSCQFTENQKFVAKYGGNLLSSTGSSSLGTNDTITIAKNGTTNTGITLTGKKSPENVTIKGVVKNNAINIVNHVDSNKYVYNGSGSLNGALLTLTMRADSMDINGVVVKQITYTFSGNKH